MKSIWEYGKILLVNPGVIHLTKERGIMRKLLLIAMLSIALVLWPMLLVGIAASPTYLPEDLQKVKAELPGGAKFGYVFVGNGKWVVPPQFEEAAYSFSRDSGLAAVKIGGKYGFINIRGQIVISPQYDKVGWSWTDDRMDVKIGDQTGYIDRTGKLVIEFQPGQCSSFSEGLATVRTDSTTKIIDTSGNVVFEVNGFCGSFRDGLAPVTIKDKGRLATGFIDKTGQWVIEPQNGLFLSSFNQGLASIRVENEYGFIDVRGNLVIQPQYDGALMFREGLAPVLLGRKIGFIDLQGRMVLPAQYDYPDNQWQPQIALGYSLFKEGMAIVKFNGKFGVIDKNGKWVVQPIFDSGLAFYPNYNVVFSAGYCYDREGKKLDHYVNHIQDGDKAMKNGDRVGAAAFYKAALKINPNDEAATWKFNQAEGR